MEKGFTIIELVVVLGIIVLLTALILPNYRQGQENLALQRSAAKLSQDLRRAQEMAMSASAGEEICDGLNGFGIHFKGSWKNHYKLFANCNLNYQFDGADKVLEDIYFEKKVKISTLSPSSDFSVFFMAPDPLTWIKGASSGIEARITLCLEEDPLKTNIIKVNTAGLIFIE